ncbi:MAG TPA: hypothetical protein VKT49_12920 [Bryobacteraceae bacterium]|nr:hypothetical protein [Bryobacteraceae bacterium]
MRHRLAAVALFVLALAPSTWLAWRWRAMPQLGLHQDDALYLVGAKSLAEGQGYRIESLPGTPFQTKYPPLLSLLMAPVWKFGPSFPENLKPAMLLVWLMLPACVLALRALFRQFGFRPREAWLLTFAAAWHPMFGLLSTAIMSDLLFLALFAGSLLLAERATGPRMAFAAGVVGGLAYLTRTAALPLVITAPLCFAYRRRLKDGFYFLAGMVPALGAWQAWSVAHMLRTSDPALLYYTNYFAMQRATVRLDNLAQVFWYNGDALLRSFGKLLTFDVVLLENVHVERILGAAAIAGAVRLVNRSGRMQYPAAAAGIAALLLVYFYPSDERICLPLFPLILMGFWTEVANYCGALRRAWGRPFAERVLAAAGAAGLAGVAVFIAAGYVFGYAVFLPKLYRACARDLQSRYPAYEWIRTRTAPDATLYAYDDPLLYLYTGRRAMGMTMPSGRIYSGRGASETDNFVRNVPRNAREHRLNYLFVTANDFYREARAGRLGDAVARDSSWRREFTAERAAVYGMARAEAY